MKYFWIFLVLFNANNLTAQGDTLYLYQIYNSFSDQGKAEWTAFDNNWNYFSYSELKSKQKIKSLNCKNCESFFAELYIEIDTNGKLTVAKFLKGKRCGIYIEDPSLKDQFVATLQNKTFSSIKNKVFKVKLGHVLKC